jgi:hypothetical protein
MNFGQSNGNGMLHFSVADLVRVLSFSFWNVTASPVSVLAVLPGTSAVSTAVEVAVVVVLVVAGSDAVVLEDEDVVLVTVVVVFSPAVLISCTAHPAKKTRTINNDSIDAYLIDNTPYNL